MTTSAFPALTEAETVFHDLVWRPVIVSLEISAETATKVLAFPIVKQVFEGSVNATTEWIFRAIVQFIDVEAISLVNSAHQSAYDSASLELKVVAIEKGVDSVEYAKARDAALQALSAFTRIGA